MAEITVVNRNIRLFINLQPVIVSVSFSILSIVLIPGAHRDLELVVCGRNILECTGIQAVPFICHLIGSRIPAGAGKCSRNTHKPSGERFSCIVRPVFAAHLNRLCRRVGRPDPVDCIIVDHIKRSVAEEKLS